MVNFNRLIKGLIWIFVLSSSIVLSTGTVFAQPTLQLDIEGGTYDWTTETIIAPDNPFTLYAYLIPNAYNTVAYDFYYISAALVPKVTLPAKLGSFTFTENTVDVHTVNVTEDMVYGVPPLETIVTLQGWDRRDLPKHGIFETYFAEFEFQFSSSNQISKYNTQDRAKYGDSIPTSGSGMYYVAFNVDTSLLDPNYAIHFDLYNTELRYNGDNDITQFAPFSHDAQSMPVPEPTTFLLLGVGILSLGIYGLYGRRRSGK